MATLLVGFKVRPATELQRTVQELKMRLAAIRVAGVEAVDDNIMITVVVDSANKAEEVTRSINEVLREVDQDLRRTYGDQR
jgi:hypothetical protein